MFRTFLSWARAHFRKTPDTTRQEPSVRWPIGPPLRLKISISKTRGRWSMLSRVSTAFFFGALCVVGGFCGFIVQTANAANADDQNFGEIERGRYLTSAADCFACHTVQNSGTPYAGGRRIETPFGFITSPNITPDQDTGIGAWTDDQFVNAVRKGVRADGAHLYPAMPYTSYT